MTDWKSIFEQLSQANGISGKETEVTQLIAKIVQPWTDELKTNTLGSLIAIKKGSGKHHPRLMISTHIDEIGFVVSAIEDGGFIRIEPRGGVDPKILPAQMLQILSREGPIPAEVCTIPPHLLLSEERDKVMVYEKMLLDTGMEEAEVKRRVLIGDPIVFLMPFKALAGTKFSGKSMDNRASALVSMKLLEALQRINHQWDVCCVFSVQEEVGCKGAKTSAYELQPSCAIALDVSFGEQPEVKEADSYPLGTALPLGIGPNFSKKLLQLIQNAGNEDQIATVLDPSPFPRGTDASTIQTVSEGIPTALISLPLRYMHTPIETIDEKDINNASRLLQGVIRKLDEEHGEGFKCL
jgi:tetrahedral aminopeptidase